MAESKSPSTLQETEHSYTVEKPENKNVCKLSTTNKNPIEKTREENMESVVVNLDAPSNKKNPVCNVSSDEEQPTESPATTEIQPIREDDTQNTSDTAIQGSDESIDYKKLIAEIDAEMSRLGWSSNKGVEYIQKHYGVKSRVQLNDVQLIEFWNHLKGLGN